MTDKIADKCPDWCQCEHHTVDIDPEVAHLAAVLRIRAGWAMSLGEATTLAQIAYAEMSDRLVAAGRRQAADAIAEKLRLAAAGRRQYAATRPREGRTATPGPHARQRGAGGGGRRRAAVRLGSVVDVDRGNARPYR